MTRSRAALALAAAAALALAAGAHEAAAEVAPYQPRDRVITVTGTAHAEAEPDVLVVRLGVETQDDGAAGALESNSAAMAAVVRAVMDAGVPEEGISTSRFGIYPVYGRYDQDAGRSELVGYRASNSVAVESRDLGAAAAIIDGAVAAGANSVDGVSFELSPAARMEARDALIAEAVGDAVDRAGLALAPLGYAVAGVKSVSLSEPGSPRPWAGPYAEAADASPRSAAPVFTPGLGVSVSATVTFLIGPA